MQLVNHGQNDNPKKKAVTDASYIPRAEKFRKNDIKGKMLRPQFEQKRFAAERLLKFELGSLGKRSKTFKTFSTLGNVGNVPGRVRRS